MTLLLFGCNFDARQSFIDPKGVVAQNQYDLFLLTVWVTGLIFALVGGALLWTVWRYREKKTDDLNSLPSQSHGNPLIEIGLIGVSVALLVVIAVPTLQQIWYTNEMPEDPESNLGAWFDGETAEDTDDEPLIIEARGWQWWFSFDYPQLGIVTGNEFAIPEGKTVRIELRGEDVIHSFWLPKIAGKVDMIPGRNNFMWVRADEPGYYYGQCAEYCGESHAYMQFRARVLPEKEFEEWVAQRRQTPPPPATESWEEFVTLSANDPEALPDTDTVKGARLFFGKGTCVQCHSIDGTFAAGKLGPNLTHVADNGSIAAGWLENINPDGSINREEQLQNFYEWVRRSEDIKPGNLMYHDPNGLQNVDLTDEEVHQIATFLQTLR
ncbi:cytochrome c oxidase subunit II [Puniceicoccus vermicola]|nr:cytochrome c oxidase subunit II [Puniceicoccus vermicola]